MRRLLLAIVGLLIALAGCGGSSDTSSGPRLSASVASDLARRSEAVARLLETGDSCAALRQVRSLAAAIKGGLRVGSIPAVLKDEIDPAVAALVRGIDCEAAVTPAPAAVETTDVAADEQENGGGNDNKDRKPKKNGHKPHGNGHGNDDKGKG
jgi:hypothetical protein